MNHMYIRLFGTPAIRINDQMVVIKRKKSRALIFYLAAAHKPISRTQLIKVLWPQFDRASALKNLSTYVHNIRSAIPELIVVDKNYLSISENVLVDAHELEKVTLDRKFSVQNNQVVDELYSSAFLEYFSMEDSYEFEQWKMEQSEYYLNQVINYKYFVAVSLMETGEDQQALDILQHILKLDPYREDVYKLAMEANCRIGNRPGAVKLFEQLNNLLKEELGISPMPDTIQLYSELITEDILNTDKRKQIKNKKMDIKTVEQSTIKEIIPKLSDSAQMLLQLLAMCDRKFDFKIMASVLGCSEEKVFVLLDELRINRAVSIGADNSIVFLSQDEKDYIYASISSPQRKYLHFRIGKAMEEAYEPSYQREQTILFHYQRSGENYLALKAAMKVGRMADEKGDIKRAIKCYEQASNYLTGRDRLELIEYMSQLMLIQGDGNEAEKLLNESAKIAGESYLLGIESCFKLQVQLIGMPEYNEIIWGGIKPQHAIELNDEIELNLWMGEHYLQNDMENLNFYIMFLHCKASCLEMQMKFEEAKECLEKILDLVMNHSNTWFENYASNCYLKLGMYEENSDRALEYLSMGIAYTASKKNWSSLPLLLAASVEYDIRSGKIEVAKKNLDWAESLDKKHLNPYVKQAIMLTRSRLELVQGNREKGIEILRELLESALKTNSCYMCETVNQGLLKLEEAAAK